MGFDLLYMAEIGLDAHKNNQMKSRGSKNKFQWW